MAGATITFAATNENLISYGIEPSFRWLIATALDGSTMTYGELKRRLQNEARFSTVFATRIGFLAGKLMHVLQEADAKAPLINVLVVNQADRQPSKGAGSFMAAKFGNRLLNSDTFKERFPDKWAYYFERAAAEVYEYSSEQWAALYEKAFGISIDQGAIVLERQSRHAGNEEDFGSGESKYGKGGEGEYHRALRLWVRDNPGEIHKSYARARTETEFSLDSGDRVDAVYHLPDRTIVLEVKSRISNEIDFRRGVYQCVKYRAVKAAMDVRSDVPIDSILVTETPVSGEISGLLKIHGITHRLVSQRR